MRVPPLALAFLTALFLSTDKALSHGFAGKRFFPATLSTDDPFVADELSLPTVSSIVTPDEGGTRDTELSVDIADAVARDELTAAVDISEVAACVREEIARRPRVLLERMAADVARALLTRFERVADVSVRIDKPEPAGLDAAAEAVELTIPRAPRSARGASRQSPRRRHA